MKRALFLVMAVLTLLSLSCSFFTGKPTESVAVATEVKPTETAPATEEPTVPPPVVEPTEPPAVEEIPTEAPPEPTTVPPTAEPEPTATEAGPIEYVETFDKRNDYWSDPLVVTTQAAGRDPFIKITVDGGVMRFAIQDKETYVYKFFRYSVDGNGSIEVVYEPRGAMNNSVSVVCRANEDMTSWYELRIISNYADYNFYRYDKSLKTEQNKNPYILLGKGRMAIKEFSPAKSNTLKFTCTDDLLIMDMNKGKKIVEQQVDEMIEGNIVGVGVQSYDIIPVAMDFDTITITQE